MSREVMHQALDALETEYSDRLYDGEGPAIAGAFEADIAALRAALAQPQAEPVAWGMLRADGLLLDVICPDEHEAFAGEYTIPLYATPQQAQPAPADCWCETCRPITLTDMRMVLCPTCGNKRCPHATDHRNACTNSNEPGQVGSSYANCAPAAPAVPAVPERKAFEQWMAVDSPERFWLQSSASLGSTAWEAWQARAMIAAAQSAADNAALQTTLADSRAYVERLKTIADEHRNGRLAALEDNAALQERVKVLREVVESAAAADVFKDSPGAMDRLAEYARAALGATS